MRSERRLRNNDAADGRGNGRIRLCIDAKTRNEHFAVILSEAKDPHRPEREPSLGRTKILRLTAQDDKAQK
jgi:hypothetical protein